jgi:hypothetical protein
MPRLYGPTQKVGRGTDLRLARAEPPLEQDYERLCETSETMMYAAMSRLMIRRLATL